MPAAPSIQGYGAGLRRTADNKKAANAARAGTLALAAFVSRPQAEAQIGANRNKSYITNFDMSI
jgi:hypothetical protein